MRKDFSQNTMLLWPIIIMRVSGEIVTSSSPAETDIARPDPHSSHADDFELITWLIIKTC
jgi:hypothetical protein